MPMDQYRMDGVRSSQNVACTTIVLAYMQIVWVQSLDKIFSTLAPIFSCWKGALCLHAHTDPQYDVFHCPR